MLQNKLHYYVALFSLASVTQSPREFKSQYFRKQGLEETKFGVPLKHRQRLCVIPKAQLNQVILWLDPEQIVQEASEFSWSII